MIDSIISYFSPKAGYQRNRYKMANHHLLENFKELEGRGYDGASKGRRTKGWKTNGNDANLETYSGLIPLRNRSRDLIRNNPYAKAAQDVVVSNVTGDGISLKLDSEENTETKNLYKKFLEWAETIEIDESNLMNFYGLQDLAMKSVFESGEVLFRRVYQKSGDYKTVPLKIQLLEADHLDHFKNETLAGGGKIIQGKEYDSRGRVVAYWIFPHHPGSNTPTIVSQRILARDMGHLYEVRRPGQARGIPWLSTVIIPLRDLDNYQDAELLKQKIASCFAGFVHDISGDAISDDDLESTLGTHVEPGAVEIMPKGKTIEFSNPPSTGSYTEFVSSNVRRVATGIGTTAEALTSDYSKTNYSSSRMAERVFNRKVDIWQKTMFFTMFCDVIWDWFLEAALLEGITTKKYTASWVPPKREQLNPKEDNEASISAIRSGLSSWADEVTARGKDPETHLKEVAYWNKKFDEYKVLFDSDARRLMKAGMLQTPTATALTPEQGNGDQNDESK